MLTFSDNIQISAADLLSILTNCLDPNKSIRSAAEVNLTYALKCKDIAITLLSLSVSNDIHISLRQMAIIILKNYMDTHWSSRTEKFVGPETPETIKVQIRSALIAVLKEPVTKIRTNITHIISKIAHLEWPEQWSNLFDLLMSQLNSSDMNQIHGTVRVLSEFVKNDITDQYFPIVAPILIPRLFSILSSPHVYPIRVRSRVVGIFKDFIELLYMVTEEHPQAAKQYLDPVLPTWLEIFHSILLSTHSDQTPLHSEIFSTVSSITKNFPKQMGQAYAKFIEIGWTNMKMIYPDYHQNTIVSTNANNSEADSDGEIINTGQLIISIFDLFRNGISLKYAKNLFASGNGSPSPFLSELILLLISFMQITLEQEEHWEDINQFIQDETDETFTFTIRVASIELLLDLTEGFQTETLRAFLAQASHILTAKEPHWKLREATLYAMTRLSSELTASSQSQRIPFDYTRLFDAFLAQDVNRYDLPILQGRAIYLSSVFAKIISLESAHKHLQMLIEMSKRQMSRHLSVFIIKSIENYCEISGADAHAETMINFLGSIALDSSSIVEIVLTSVQKCVKLNENVSIRYGDAMCSLILSVWDSFLQDHVVVSICCEMLETLCKSKAIHAMIEKKVVHVLHSIISTHAMSEDQVSTVACALDMIRVILVNADKCDPTYVQVIFPDIAKIMMSIETHEILQNGQEFLMHLLMKDVDRLLSFSDGSSSGLDLLVQIITKLLDPQRDESCALFTGELINTLFKKGGEKVHSLMSNILTLVVLRLESSKKPMFIQSLILIFAELLREPSAIPHLIEFLSTLRTPNGQSGLDVVITTWCDNYTYFNGFYVLKLSPYALSVLVESGDARLDSIIVNGDLIITSTRVVTRSRSKTTPDTYERIPFLAKAIKLLTLDLLQNMECKIESVEEDGDMGSSEFGSDDDDKAWVDENKLNQKQFKILQEFTKDVVTEEENAELRNDAVYNMDIKEYLLKFIKSKSQLCEQFLNEREKDMLSRALSLVYS